MKKSLVTVGKSQNHQGLMVCLVFQHEKQEKVLTRNSFEKNHFGLIQKLC